MNSKISRDLTCTQCNKVVETYSEIVYSQGDKVCLECKEDNQQGDNRAFDRDMDLRRFGPFESFEDL